MSFKVAMAHWPKVNTIYMGGSGNIYIGGSESLYDTCKQESAPSPSFLENTYYQVGHYSFTCMRRKIGPFEFMEVVSQGWMKNPHKVMSTSSLMQHRWWLASS